MTDGGRLKVRDFKDNAFRCIDCHIIEYHKPKLECDIKCDSNCNEWRIENGLCNGCTYIKHKLLYVNKKSYFMICNDIYCKPVLCRLCNKKMCIYCWCIKSELCLICENEIVKID
jgi:hypothetical protein